MKDRAADLLEILWAGISSDYKSKYRRTIWDQFQSTVRSCAHTNNLGKFANTMSSKMNISIPNKYVVKLDRLLNGGDDKEILKIYRDETLTMVLMVRVCNEQRKEKYSNE